MCLHRTSNPAVNTTTYGSKPVLRSGGDGKYSLEHHSPPATPSLTSAEFPNLFRGDGGRQRTRTRTRGTRLWRPRTLGRSRIPAYPTNTQHIYAGEPPAPVGAVPPNIPPPGGRGGRTRRRRIQQYPPTGTKSGIIRTHVTAAALMYQDGTPVLHTYPSLGIP